MCAEVRRDEVTVFFFCFCLMFLYFLLLFSVHGEAHLLSPNDEAGCPFLALSIMICIKNCFNSFTYLPNKQVLAYFVISSHRDRRETHSF